MATRRRALLFLPSPQGLVEYDVLEDAVFLGVTKDRGLTAAPSPFREATLALTWNGTSFEARALPGEAPPEVNGQAADGAALEDGARIRIADQVVLFRESRPAAAARPVAAEVPGAGARRPAAARRPVRRSSPWVTAVALVGAGLLLVAVWRVVEHMKDMKAARETGLDAPEPPASAPPGAPPVERAARDLEKIREQERANPDDLRGTIDRYRDFVEQRHPGTAEAEAAAARIRELLAEAARRDMDRLEAEAPMRTAGGDFDGLLADLRKIESRYGTTPAARRAEELAGKTQAAARRALDALVAQVGPLIATDPRRAHAALVGARLRLPADIASELAALLERTGALIRATGGGARPPTAPVEAPPPSKAPGPVPAAGSPPEPSTPSPEPAPSPEPGPTPPGISEAEVVTAWRAARGDLLAGRFEEALVLYDALLARSAESETVRAHRGKVEAGRKAARAGAKGPGALLAVPSETKAGRITFEYGFSDSTSADAWLQADFAVVKPFPSDLAESVEAKGGVVRLSGASGLFHNLVFSADVRIEAEAVAEIPRDLGLLAVEDSDAFRAILFDVANTQFKLKKGDAAKVQPGHVLWLIGEGAWSAADSGVHGFIKIAERPNSKLEGGDVIRLELERKRDRCSGGFQGRTDGVALEGTVKGDDGRGMGAAQVGLFTNGGTLVVRRVRISGVVDERWWAARLQQLVRADPGPP